MPRKKRRGSCIKQKQIIRTRLIELSMKVEDLIYQKMPISETEAEAFLTEVTSYKMECSTDERALQVIEKLTRCMKAIIAEHEELRLNGSTREDEFSHEENIRAASLSPVYSLPDEDRTQFTQEQVKNINEVSKSKEDFHTTELNQSIQNTVADNSNKITEIIHLCDDEDNLIAVAGTSSQVNADVDMHKALSNLSIKDNDNQYEQMSTDVECSQSILRNFEGINILQQNITEVNKSSTGKIIKTVEDVNTKENTNLKVSDCITVMKATGAYKHILNNPLVLKVSKAINNIVNGENVTNSEQIISIVNMNDKEKHNTTATNVNYMQQTCTQFIDSGNIINANLNDTTCDSYISYNNETTNTQTVTKTKFQDNNPNKNKNPPDIIHKKRGPRKNKENEIKANKVEASRVKNEKSNKSIKTGAMRKKSNKKMNVSSIPIYNNNNVINDLSWLEGIRFVREIRENEYETLKHIDEKFWDNYYLPPNFDDNDFL